MTFEEFIEEWRGESEFIEARTSGSTGEPKLIRLPKPFVRASALRSNNFFCINSQSRLHSCVAPDYIGGKMMAVRAETAGCRLTWETPSNAPLRGIGAKEKIDLLAVVPSQMLHILENKKDLPSIRTVIIGGSPINASLRDRIMASDLCAYETYGMTETSSHIALRKVGNEWFSTLEGIRVDKDDRGCLVICFDTGEVFRTNDLASVESSNRFKINGRIDNIIITGGKKVNPIDVECRISHLFSTPFIITSSPDLKWGMKVVLKVERGEKAGGRPVENHRAWESEKKEEEAASRLFEKLREVFSSHEMPKVIEWVDKLPRTANGKLKR